MGEFFKQFEDIVGLNAAIQLHLVQSLIAIAIIWAGKTILLKLAFRRIHDVQSRYRWQKTAWYTAVTLTVLIVGRIWFEGIHSLATFLGLVSAGVAIALKDPLLNIAGWVYIVSRRPFHVGDRITTSEFDGDIVDQGMFHFAIMEIGAWVDADQNTGRIIYIPNATIFNKPVGNYSEGWFEYIWTELKFCLTFESDWKKAKRIANDIVMKHGKPLSHAAQRKVSQTTGRYLVFQSSVQPTVYTSMKEHGIQLSARYLCDPRRRRHSEQAVWEELLDAFSVHDDIQFAYPTQRFYQQSVDAPTRPHRYGEKANAEHKASNSGDDDLLAGK